MKRSLLAAALVSGLLAAGAPSAAFAASPAPTPVVQLTAEQESDFTSFLTSHGVSTATAKKLLAKYESGHFLDSTTGKNKISSSTSLVDGQTVTISRYADGSVSENSVQTPTPTVASTAPVSGGPVIRTVGSCNSVQSSSYSTVYTFCLVSNKDATINMSFRATFIAARYGGSQIQSVSNALATAVGGKTTSESLNIPQPTQDGQTYARAVHSVKVTIVKGGASLGAIQYLFVHDATVSSELDDNGQSS